MKDKSSSAQDISFSKKCLTTKTMRITEPDDGSLQVSSCVHVHKCMSLAYMWIFGLLII